MFGFLNIYKPKGKTSHDVVAVLRRITKIKQIGHTGTLDPFAEGVLPICIGKATRLIEYLNDDKAYIGTIQLGKSTTTYDIDGECVNFSDKKVDIEEIKSAVENFIGEIEQKPPIYSALKVNGKKLYEYAREGKEIEIKSRKVTVSELNILNFNETEQILELYIACSKGTYIRSIANDLGEKLGTYGHLVKLVRVKAGRFLIEKSVPLDNLDTQEKVKDNLISPLEYLDYRKYEICDDEAAKIKNGMEIILNTDFSTKPETTVLLYNGTIASIGNTLNGKFKPSKVFL